jgi:hypothetical protein
MKDQLVFDTTDVDTIADSDHVGSHTLSGSGKLIDSTTAASKEWLNVASMLYDSTGAAITDSNPLAVSVKDGVNVEVDLSHVDDSVRLGNGTDFFTSTSENGDIALDVHISNSDLDIRDLVADTDSVGSFTKDGAGTSITSSVVGANTGLDVNIINSLSVNDAALAETSLVSAAETLDVASTAQDIIASPLADRKYLFVYNNDNRKMFIGGAGVTEANGFPISPSSYMELRAGSAVAIEFISSKLDHEIRTLELK